MDFPNDFGDDDMPEKRNYGSAEIARAFRSSRSAGSRDDSGEIAGGQPVEDVEDRANVGTVRPEDYPDDQRAKGRTD
jgi:hypothetical protein